MCRRQVRKAIDDFDMLTTDDRILVAVSGGKDSLAVWDMLIDLGYQADGLYVGLGIGEYSDMSGEYARAFADERGLHLIEVSLRDEYGYDVPTATAATRRVPCSACGMSKRHLFDKAAIDGGYTVLVTGHNLDDEAAVLYGNTLRWELEYLARQLPVLPARNGFPKKVKPLVRLSEREMAAWCVRPRHRLPRRRVPDRGRQQAPRVQGGAEHDRGRFAGHEDRVLPQLRREGRAAVRRSFALGDDVDAAARARAADRRRPARSARSATWSRSRRRHEPVPVELITGKGDARR